MRTRLPLLERMQRKSVRDAETGCLVWLGCRIGNKLGSGHGYIQRGSRGEGRVLLHRASWEMVNGPIPEGQSVLHRCDNPPCWEPSHLFLGTRADNVRDAASKNRLPFGYNHWATKLSESDVREILMSGDKNFELAHRYGVDPSTISKLRSGAQRRKVL